MKRFALAVTTLIIMAAAWAFLAAPPAEADCPVVRPRVVTGHGVHYGRGYARAAHVVHAPHAVDHHRKDLLVSPVRVNDYYWTVQDYYRDHLFADVVSARVARDLRGEAGPAPPGYGPAPVPKGPLMPTIPDRPPPGAPLAPFPGGILPSAPLSTLDPETMAKVQKIVNDACLKCHNSEIKKAGLDLTDLTRLTRETAYVMFEEIESGRMPDKGEPIRNEDIDLFRRFSRSFVRGKVASR